jgi:hypothetical protein
VNRASPARAPARRALVAAALAAALAAPTALAAPATGSAAPAPQKEATSSRPAASRAARADVPLPPPPAGTRLERRGATLGVAVGPWAAFDTGKSFAAHLDYGFPRTPPTWSRLELEYRLAVMISRPSEDTTLSRTALPGQPQLDVGTKKTRVWLFEAVPTARVRYPVGPTFALVADGGLGLAQTLERYESEETFVGHAVKTRNVTGLVVRVGGGATLDVGERLRFVFLPVALSFQLGPGYGGYAPSLGIAYRM